MRKGFLPAPRRWSPVVGRVRWLRAPGVSPLFAIPALVLLACSTLGSVSAAEWKGQRIMKDGVLHVLNPSEPMEPPEVYVMQELWRLESETPEGDVVFGAPTAIRWDTNGNAYILDNALWAIHVLSPAGELLRTIGRRGEGPGEFQEAGDFFIDDESRLGVVDFRSRQIVYFRLDGTPADSWTADSTQALRLLPFSAWPTPEGLVLSCRTFAPRDASSATFRYFAAIFDKSGHRGPTLFQREQILIRGKTTEFDEEKCENVDFVAVSPEGDLYVSPDFSEYRILGFDPSGRARIVIQRRYQHLPRTATQLADTQSLLTAKYSEWRNAVARAKSYNRDVMSLRVREDGMLWVETSRGWLATEPGVALRIDLFDRDGVFRRQVVIRGPLNGWSDFMSVCGTRALRVASAVGTLKSTMGAQTPNGNTDQAMEDAPPALIGYELKRVE
jgi:hypothetical protein